MSNPNVAATPEEVQDWVLVQQKSFLKLINRYMKEEDDKITDVTTDFRSGRKLLLFLKYALNTTVPEPERGTKKLHYINTVNKAIAVMKRENVKVVDIGAEEIVDGNLKMTLGVVWAVILKSIENIKEGGASAKDGLLLWCQRKTADYENVKIKDFASSWKNGLAFCALIHAHRPDLFDYNSLSPANAAENLEKAFSIAETEFDISRIMDVQDMVGSVYIDDKSLMAYISMFYHYFSKFKDIEIAGKRLEKIFEENEENANIIKDYEASSSTLLAWMKEKIPFLQDRCGDNPNIETIKQKFAALAEYRTNEKPPRDAEKTKVESEYQSVQTKLSIQNRPQYVPPDELNPKFLDEMWKKMEKEEQTLFKWLEETLRMLDKVERLCIRFMYKCTKQEEWMKKTIDELTSTKFNADMGLSELYGFSKKSKATEAAIKLRENKNEELLKMKDEIVNSKSSQSSEVLARYDSVTKQWTVLLEKEREYVKNLDDITKICQKLDDDRLEFSSSANSVKIWLDDAMEEYEDEHKPREIKEIEKWKEDHQSFTNSMSSQVSAISDLKKREKDISAISSIPNPYTSLSVGQLESRMEELNALWKKRSDMLDEEYKKAQESATLHDQFNSVISTMESWKQQLIDKVSDTLFDKSSSLESKKDLLKGFQAELDTHMAENMPKVDELNAKITDLASLNWEQVSNTTMNHKSSFDKAVRNITGMISEVDNQIVIRDSSGISDKEMADIKGAFDLFAKEDKNSLNPNELLSCLISLGFSLKMDIDKNEEFTKILTIVDPLCSKKISQSALIAFVTSQRKSANSASEIIETFKSMAHGKAYILPEEIKRALNSKHAEDCLKNMKPFEGPDAPQGALDYRSYASSIFGETDV